MLEGCIYISSLNITRRKRFRGDETNTRILHYTPPRPTCAYTSTFMHTWNLYSRVWYETWIRKREKERNTHHIHTFTSTSQSRDHVIMSELRTLFCMEHMSDVVLLSTLRIVYKYIRPININIKHKHKHRPKYRIQQRHKSIGKSSYIVSLM